MNKEKILDIILERKQRNEKSVAVLLDPDCVNFNALKHLVQLCEENGVHYFFVGGSLLYSDNFDRLIIELKAITSIPVIIFPGNNSHISPNADAILLLSLVSGRNPEFLIGQHIIAAPLLKRSKLAILSTAYLLIDSGLPTTVSYISNTTPIPYNKPQIAATTALAAEMIGMSITYLDGGSGAKFPISEEMISMVSKAVSSPLIVGGGINTFEKLENAFIAGADIVVVGNAIEENPDFIFEIGSLYQTTSSDF